MTLTEAEKRKIREEEKYRQVSPRNSFYFANREIKKTYLFLYKSSI